MTKLGGAYLNPIIFFSDHYNNGDFKESAFWENERKSWGTIVHTFPHKSFCKVVRNGANFNLESNSNVYLTTDGLISTEVPESATSDEEALILLSSHLSTFLSLLNLGGLYLSPISEKNISHVELIDGYLYQVSATGDNYSMVSMERALQRLTIPYRSGTTIIDFNWPIMRIRKESEVVACYNLGKSISDRLDFKSTEVTLSLEAYKNYTFHKWNNTLLLGWAFIEILIDRIWKKLILTNISASEEKRKERLKDNRTFSASVKTEVLYVDGVLNIETYNHLNKLRSIRNSLIHSGHSVTEIEVSVIFDLTKILIKILTGMEPKLNNPGWTRSGGWVDNG